jgi:Flp pilus assembly protein protease CpaA
MELLDSLRFVLGVSMLGYGAWTDHKTRRVPNQTWLISGTIASVLLAYEFTTEEYSLYIWALLVATIVLFYNAFVDEYVLDNNQMMLWRAVQVFGILCAAYFLFSVESEELSAQDYKLVDVVSISILILLMYVWFYLGPTIGGADVKAIMTLGLVTPFTLSFSGDTFTAFETRGFPYPFVIFMNSLLLYLLIPLSLAVYNLFKGNLEKPYFQIFFGTKMKIDLARESFVWPMQQIIGGKVVMVAFVKNKDDSDTQWDKLEESGVDNPWITFKIPYIIPLALAFVLSAIFGDLFSHYLVAPLNSLFG